MGDYGDMVPGPGTMMTLLVFSAIGVVALIYILFEFAMWLINHLRFV